MLPLHHTPKMSAPIQEDVEQETDNELLQERKGNHESKRRILDQVTDTELYTSDSSDITKGPWALNDYFFSASSTDTPLLMRLLKVEGEMP